MWESLIIAIVVGFIWYQVISHWSASILLHRYYCHKQFEIPAWFEVVGLFLLSITYIKSPIGWIAAHRMHHAYSDTENDPHSWQHKGKWTVLTTTWTIPRIPKKFAKDLYQNKKLVFLHKYYLWILLAQHGISFAISPYVWLAYAGMPFICASIGYGLLNTFGHAEFGGSNRAWLNLLTAGEGFHKEHHDNWKRVRLHKWDTGGWIAEKLFDNKTGLLRKR